MFLTQDDCQTVCPTYENPCGSDGDPCSQDLAVGEGGFLLTRYYFDKESRRCREFAYQGSKGNANNFLSQEDCELVCPVLPNPCRVGEPLLNALKEPIICGGEDSCINGYWCHVGGSPETTNCCPGTRRPCDLPLEIGQGSEQLERWFYDGGIQMCRTFTYKGMKGNSNNFLTKQACRQACKDVESCDQPVDLGTGSEDLPRWFFDKKQNRCAPFSYGGIGGNENNFISQVTCSEACPVYRNYCPHGIPLVDGNVVTACGIDRGCPDGFICHMSSEFNVSICCQPVDLGTGSEDLPRWFIDKKQNRCAPFSYGGIGGNENNFISQVTCSEACPVYRNYCPHGIPLVDGNVVTACGIDRGCPDGFICHMSSEFNVSICCQDPVDFCSAPRDPGPCTDFETRYGYNSASDTCVEYQYGGCDGTLNNFRSLQRCTEICCKEYKRKL
ncbi:unnamed protein product [Heligmosomoides polygyrus]|uniref:Kunitz/Bovine pancreatic trypsin inhibitor domain protein n=1 Tax=Heligmosomoides polygyrus TaxID=6339 RepID=A0A183GGE4_HELPZ|nr:unnamed protein product [Heligmosomoides polygyrus]